MYECLHLILATSIILFPSKHDSLIKAHTKPFRQQIYMRRILSTVEKTATVLILIFLERFSSLE
jgi:hypothetical protein